MTYWQTTFIMKMSTKGDRKEGTVTNINKLKAKIIERGHNVEWLAKVAGINKTTMYRRLNAGGGDFTLKEVAAIREALELTIEETNLIFFADSVAN